MPRISTLKRERLQQLLGLYGGSCVSEDVPKHIYTVDMLYDPLTPESTSKIESHTSSTHYTDTWTKCDGKYRDVIVVIVCCVVYISFLLRIRLVKCSDRLHA